MAAHVFDNYDMDSWWIASQAVQAGEPVYAATHRYNYGPAWSYIIGSLRYLSQLTGADTITRLHLFITALLTCADIGLSLLLYRIASPLIAVLFFLNPISTIVTGYHVQFDNVAILLGLLGWFTFIGSTSWRATIVASLLFGASLSLKHIFSLFLAWLPFMSGSRPLRHRITFGAVALFTFIVSFLPWINHPAAWAGIQANVFGYISTEGHSLTSFLAMLLPGTSARSLFMALVSVAGVLLMLNPKLHRIAPFVYLVTITALSSGMARNYLAIPLVGVFYFLTYWPARAYLIVATASLVTINQDLGVSEVVAHLSSSTLVTYELSQCVLVLLLTDMYRKRAKTPPTEPVPLPA